MDIVLCCLDSLVLDNLYATLLPRVVISQHMTRPQNVSHWTPDNSASQTPTLLPSFDSLEASQSPFLCPTHSVFENASQLQRHGILRQTLSLFMITCVFGLLTYLITATLSYILIFDKRDAQHPKFLRNQISMEIATAVSAVPSMAALTVPFFLGEVRGHSYMYDSVMDSEDQHFMFQVFGKAYDVIQIPLFLMFTDCGVYWIHRALHSKMLYKRLHKPHHQWIIPSPFASHAFHPLDGFLQSLPYHIFPFIFPLRKLVYLSLFIFIQLWTVMIHDGYFVVKSPLINGTACHSLHHLQFNFNFGQYFTLWDRIGGTYRRPSVEQKADGGLATTSKKLSMSREGAREHKRVTALKRHR